MPDMEYGIVCGFNLKEAVLVEDAYEKDEFSSGPGYA
jgi:hypothetical protein